MKQMMMKKLFLLVFTLVALGAQAQYTYLPSTDGQGLPRPVGVTGQPTDARSFFHDRTNFTYRPYQNTAQVLAYLNSANSRKGGFIIWINTGGTLANGLITGGTNTAYVFKDGVADNNLVPFAPASNTDTTSLSNRINAKQNKLTFSENLFYDSSTNTLSASGGSLPTVTSRFKGNGTSGNPLDIATAVKNEYLAAMVARWFGDSMTQGIGGTQTPEYPSGTPITEHVKAITGWNILNYGVGGETSTQIRTRVVADSANKFLPTILWMGTNDLGQNATILANIRTSVRALAHSRYLIIELIGHNSNLYWPNDASGLNPALHALNDSIELQNPRHLVRIRQPLIDAYDHSIPADTMAHFHDVWPPSFGAPGDNVHLNDAGYRFVANLVAAKMDSLLLSESDGKVLTATALRRIMSTPGVIGGTTPSSIAASVLSVGSTAVLEPAYITNGQGTALKQLVNIGGGVDFMYPGLSNGMRIRPRYSDVSGFPALEITGTNQSIWPSGGGLTFYNHSRLVELGSGANNTQFKLFGDHIVTGDNDLNRATISGRLNVQGGITNAGPFVAPQRILELTNPGGPLNGGVILPLMTGSSWPNIFSLRRGEIGYDLDVERMQYVVPDPTITNAYKRVTIAGLADIPHPTFTKGAGIGITGNETTGYTISNTTVPPAAEITPVSFFESRPGNNADTVNRSASKAFDHDLTTTYGSASNDVNANNYLGGNLGRPYILTKFRFRGQNGFIFTGSKLQGSNTTDSTGFVDLFTVDSTHNPYGWNEYGIESNTAYKYVRLTQAPNTYIMRVQELEIYGYIASIPPDVFAGENNNFTKSNVFNDTIFAKKIIPISGTADSAVVRNAATGQLYMQKLAASGGTSTDTTSLSTRINANYTNIVALNDSMVAFRRPNGTQDTLKVAGIAGGSGGSGGGTGTVTSVSSGSISGFATVTVNTATTTPAIVYSLSAAPAHQYWGNGGPSSAAPSYTSLDSSDIAQFYLKVRGLFSGGSNITYNNGTGSISAATQVDASVFTTGTFPDDRFSTNVPLKNTANTYSLAQAFTSNILARGGIRTDGYELDIFGGTSGETWLNYGSRLIGRSADNAVSRIEFNQGGAGNLLLYNASGAPVISLDATNGAINTNTFVRAYTPGFAAIGVELKGDSGVISAASLKTGTLGLKKWVVADESGRLSLQTITSGSSGSTVFRNAQTPGTDTLAKVRTGTTTDTVTIANIKVASGAGITVVPTITDTSKIYTVNLTPGAASSGGDIIPITGSYTISVSNGFQQYITFSGSTGQTLTFPTTSAADGMIITFRNTTNNSIAVGGTSFLRTSASTTGTTIPALYYGTFIKKVGSTDWWEMGK